MRNLRLANIIIMTLLLLSAYSTAGSLAGAVDEAELVGNTNSIQVGDRHTSSLDNHQITQPGDDLLYGSDRSRSVDRSKELRNGFDRTESGDDLRNHASPYIDIKTEKEHYIPVDKESEFFYYREDPEIGNKGDPVVRIVDDQIEYLVKSTADFDPMTLTSLYTQANAEYISSQPSIATHLFRVSLDTLYDFKAQLEAMDTVEYMEPHFYRSLDLIPNDLSWADQWGPQLIDMPNAWDINTGDRNVIVAVIDTGIDYTHEDLGDAYLPLGYDWYNGDSDPMDGHSHGTHVAGTIAASINNSIGVAGMANVSVIAEKIFSDSGSFAGDINAAAAINHAVSQGADILSNSWGGGGYSQVLADAVADAVSSGSMFIAAAGNSAVDSIHYPAGYPGAIAVSATDETDSLASFSNYGNWVDIAAPGVNILSSVPGNTYDYYSGTSMATPHVSGLAALIMSQFSYTPSQVEILLYSSADDLGLPGFDTNYGHGRINGYSAMLGLPDTEIDVSLTVPQQQELGKITTVTATIQNRGLLDQTDVAFSLFLDEMVVNSTTIPILTSGDSFILEYTWQPNLTGSYNFTAASPVLVGEADTTNNRVEKQVDIITLNNYRESYPAFTWYDAATNGINLGMTGDDISSSVTLPFDFEFYGINFSTVYISSNGWLSFSDSSPTSFMNPSFPTDSYPYAIAPLWDDLKADNNIYAYSTTDYVVIEYNNYYSLSGALYGTFAVVLHSDGTIEFLFQSIVNHESPTVGLNYGLDTSYYNSYTGNLNGLSDFAILYNNTQPDRDLSVSLDSPMITTTDTTTTITAVLINDGKEALVDIGFTLSIDSVVVNSATIATLVSGQAHFLTYEWTPLTTGTYNISTYATPVSQEEVTQNNFAAQNTSVNAPLDLVPGDVMTYEWDDGRREVWNFTGWSVVDKIIEGNVTMISPLGMVDGVDSFSLDLVSGLITGSWLSGTYFIYTTSSGLELGSMVYYFTVYGEVIAETTVNYRGTDIETWEVLLPDWGEVIYFDKITGLNLNHTYNFALVQSNQLGYNQDLGLDGLDIPQYVEPGTSPSLNFRVTNYGLTTISSIDVVLAINGTSVYTETIDTLVPGEFALIQYSFTAANNTLYQFDVSVTPAPSETYTVDNSMSFDVICSSAIKDKTYGFIQVETYDDQTGNPLGGVLVEVFNDTGQLVSSGTTDATGFLNVTGLDVGYYEVILSAAGYETSYFGIFIDYIGDTEYIWAYLIPIIDHDLVVVLDTPTVINPNTPVTISSTVSNNGINDETDVAFYLYLDEVIVSSQLIPSLLTGNSFTLTFDWNSGISGSYNFTAYAVPVTNETMVSNNRQEQWVQVVESTLLSDFESGAWTGDGLWHLTNDSTTYGRSYSPTHSMWYGDEKTGNFDTGSQNSGMMLSPTYQLGSDVIALSFWNWYDTESGTSFDQKLVYILDENGAMTLLGQISGSQNQWTYVVFDISAYAGQLVRFAFMMDTIDSIANDGLGWFIDDISVLGSATFAPQHDLLVEFDTPVAIGLGESLQLSATAINWGDYVETDVNLTIYLDEVMVNSMITSTLDLLESGTLEYSWTPVDYGNYNLTAYVTPVAGESNLANNRITTFVDVLDRDQEFGFIEATVVDDTTSGPIENAFLEIFDDLGNLVDTGNTDIDGFYNITGLDPGYYQIRTSATDYEDLYTGVYIGSIGEGQFLTVSLVPVVQQTIEITNIVNGTIINGSLVYIEYQLSDPSIDFIDVFVNDVYITTLWDYDNVDSAYVPVFSNGTNLIRVVAYWQTGVSDSHTVQITSNEVIAIADPVPGDTIDMRFVDSSASQLHDFNFTVLYYTSPYEVNISLTIHRYYPNGTTTELVEEWLVVNILNGYIPSSSMWWQYQQFYFFSGLHADATVSAISIGDRSAYWQWDSFMTVQGSTSIYGEEGYLVSLRDGSTGYVRASDGLFVAELTSYGQTFIVDSTYITDTVSPSFVSTPADISLILPISNVDLTWTFEDINPDRFVLTQNGGAVYEGYWVDMFSYNIDYLPQGSYTFVLTLYDSYGNSVSDEVLVTVEDDTETPSFTSTPLDLTYVEGQTGNMLSWTASDTNPDTYSITRDGVEVASGSWQSGTAINLNVDGLSVGSYTYVITIFDSQGNSASDTVLVTVNPDSTPPAFIITPADLNHEEGVTGNILSWTVSDTNPDTYSITRDGVEVATGIWQSGTAINLNVDGLSVGSYTYVITVRDQYGNSDTDTAIVTVNPDTTAPIFITIPPDFSYEDGTTYNQVMWTGSDLLPDQYRIYQNGTEVASGTWTSGVLISYSVDGLEPNNYNFTITIFDQRGNSASDTVIVTVTPDTTPPTFTMTPPDISYEQGETGHVLAWRATDFHPDTYSITRDEVEVASGSWLSGTTINLSVDGLNVGTYTYTITFWDQEGNFASNSVTVVVDPDSTDPTFSETPDDLSYEEGTTGNVLSWTTSDINPDTYSISLDDEEVASGGWISGVAINLNVDGLSVGTYSYTITLSDVAGNTASDSVIVTIVDTTDPAFSEVQDDLSYEEGTTGNVLSWTASDINPDTYSISLDDDEVASGGWITDTAITFNVDGLTAGTYTYTITITDVSGNSASDSVTVTVTPEETTSSETSSETSTETPSETDITSEPSDTEQTETSNTDEDAPGFELNLIFLVAVLAITVVVRRKRM